MKFFQKKYKTDNDGRTYTMQWSADWMKKNPWCSGLTFTISALGRTYGFSVKLTNSIVLPKQGGGLRQVFHPVVIDLEVYRGKTASLLSIRSSQRRHGWSKMHERQTYRTAIDKDYIGLLVTAYIKDFSIGMSLDVESSIRDAFYLGFLTIRRLRHIWVPGFNDHEFPTTPYGEYACSLSRKEKQRFLAVERALKGTSARGVNGAYSIALTAIRNTTGAGISHSIPSKPQAFSASSTTFIQS